MSFDAPRAKTSACIDLRGLAIRLRQRGYVCVPLRPGGKHLDLAAMGVNPVHFQNRNKRLKELAFTSVLFRFIEHPPDEAALTSWFSNPGVNIGLATGVGGLVVLDFDEPRLYEAWRRRYASIVDASPVCKSPSGHHVLLRHDQPLVSSSLHLGFRRAGHVKAVGGYVACPPSILAKGSAYSWLAGQSPTNREPQRIDSLQEIGVLQVSPFKRAYDRLLGRGSFEDH